MKKLITLLAMVALASNVALAANNGKGSDTPKNQKGSEAPKNDKGSEVPEVVVEEMCQEIGYAFGPGDLQCNRNWFVCTEADAGVDFICNILPELPVNVIKIPLNALEEGAKKAAHCLSKSDEIGPFALLLAPVCLGLGAVQGAAEGVVGTLAGFFEITGNTSVLYVISGHDLD